MTAFTDYIHVRACQWEITKIMVEIRITPIRGGMAGGAICPKPTLVCVVLLMTGEAIHRRALELTVYMAGLASHFCMFALQLECCEGVIERRRPPSIHRMACCTILPKATLMRLIVEVTGITILRSRRKVHQSSRVDMAPHTGNTDVSTGELERKHIVIKIRTKLIHTVMTVETR